ncbi:hypothetical protein B0H11DRAFT_1917742 [Mycena galericulata]|nr:hypothetical protein B0H11DRAFT_1917742 [Mycena galericulata]
MRIRYSEGAFGTRCGREGSGEVNEKIGIKWKKLKSRVQVWLKADLWNHEEFIIHAKMGWKITYYLILLPQHCNVADKLRLLQLAACHSQGLPLWRNTFSPVNLAQFPSGITLIPVKQHLRYAHMAIWEMLGHTGDRAVPPEGLKSNPRTTVRLDTKFRQIFGSGRHRFGQIGGPIAGPQMESSDSGATVIRGQIKVRTLFKHWQLPYLLVETELCGDKLGMEWSAQDI